MVSFQFLVFLFLGGHSLPFRFPIPRYPNFSQSVKDLQGPKVSLGTMPAKLSFDRDYDTMICYNCSNISETCVNECMGFCTGFVCVCVCVISVCVCVFVVQVHLNGTVFTTKMMQFSDPFNCPSVCLNLDRANQSTKMEEAGKNTSDRIAIIQTHKKKRLAFIFEVIALFVQGNNNILETLPLPSLSLQGSQNH